MEDTKDYVLFMPRKILQTAQSHPVITLTLSVTLIVGFLPVFLFASFIMGSMGIVLFHVLAVQSAAGLIVFFGLLGVLFLVIPISGVVLTSLYLMYSFWMSVYHSYSYVVNVVAQLCSFISSAFRELKIRHFRKRY